MAYETTPGSLSLFKNEKKTEAKHPDYRGQGKQLDGSEVWVAAWIKEAASGQKYLSLQIQPKEVMASPKPPTSTDPDFPL